MVSMVWAEHFKLCNNEHQSLKALLNSISFQDTNSFCLNLVNTVKKNIRKENFLDTTQKRIKKTKIEAVSISQATCEFNINYCHIGLVDHKCILTIPHT